MINFLKNTKADKFRQSKRLFYLLFILHRYSYKLVDLGRLKINSDPTPSVLTTSMFSP